MSNVAAVVDANLCNGCCECISACVSNNVFIMYDVTLGHPIPYIGEGTCNNCGECLSTCKQAGLLDLQIS